MVTMTTTSVVIKQASFALTVSIALIALTRLNTLLASVHWAINYMLLGYSPSWYCHLTARRVGKKERGGMEEGRGAAEKGGGEREHNNYCTPLTLILFGSFASLLEEIYEDLGDTLAVQYGGSQLVHR